MDKNKIIIIALIVIIIILTISIFSIMLHDNKQDSKIIIKANSTIYQGDTIDIVLTDSNNNPLSNKTVIVNITGENNFNDYMIKTDSRGIGKLKINNTEGNYTINCTFNGDDEYNGNTSFKNVIVEIKQAVTSLNSADSTTYTEPEYGSDSYVEKWDKSQRAGDSWSYTHDQPVKHEGGHDYKRMYDEDTGESYWYQMDHDFYE